jgi:Tol biopolymer transport system component/DNA-binding SARP family transcriptional activator
MIELALLGGVRLTGGDSERMAGLLAQPKRVALLAYLTLARPHGFQNRDTLLALFWPDQDEQHARWALNQAVHYLRGALGDSVVLRRGEDISLDVARINCDAIALEAAYAARRWDEAVGLYQGELLPGLRPGGAAELEHWLDGERDRLRRLAADAARNRSEELVASGDLPGAGEAARQAVRFAPDDETGVRRLIERLSAAGDRAGATQVYREYVAWLKQERDLEPAPETRALLEVLQEDYDVPRPVLGGGSTPAPTTPVKPATSGGGVRAVISVAAAVFLVGGVALTIRALAPTPLDITASELTQVTDDPGVEFQPAISPDGSEVAYTVGPVHSTHVVIRTTQHNPGGGEVRLPLEMSEAFPMWSPGGERLRFDGCRNGGCAWHEIAKLGGTVRPAKLPAQVTAMVWSPFLAWSPDGGRIVYAVGETLFVSQAADTATPHRIAIQPGAWALHSLAWSPDGSLIAYENGNAGWASIGNLDAGAIWVVNSTGGTPRQVTSGEQLNVYPVWLDNQHLLFVSDRDGARGVYVVEVGPEGAREAPRIIPGVADPHSISYAIGPKRLAWAKYTQRQNVWSYPLGSPSPISIRTGTPVTTSNQVVELVDVSPDGKWLAFDSNRRGNQDLYMLSLAGGALIPLTDAPMHEAAPRWSPDGTEIAFHSALGNNTSSIMVVSTRGGTPEALTNATGLSGYPTWSPDGLHLVFSSNRSGHGQVWLLSRDSLRGMWHDAVLLSDDYYRVHDWAPDGRGVLIANSEKISLVSTQGTVLWTRDFEASGLNQHWWGRFSRDGKVIYLVARHADGRRGVWAIPMGNRPPRLIIADDDPALTFEGGIALGRDRIYLTVTEYESDIWTAKLTW